MTIDADKTERYLVALFEGTQGDTTPQISMYEVGSAIGLEKTEAGKVAEELISQGLAEIRTLSGGIGITADGVAAARAAGAGGDVAPAIQALGPGPVLTQTDRQTVAAALDAVRKEIAALSQPFEKLETLVLDIKTADVQLLSPQPKTAVIREVLRALQNELETMGRGELAGRLKQVAGQ